MRIHSVTAEFLSVNCYAVAAQHSDSCLLVDAGLDAGADMAALLTGLGWEPAAVLLTHGHPDHVLGLPGYGRFGRLPVYLGAPDHYRLADPAATLEGQFGQIVRSLAPDWTPVHAQDTPAGAPLTIAGLEISALPCPGHTEGSTVLTVRDTTMADDDAENTALAHFTGDVLFAGSIGRTDLPGGNAQAMADSLRQVCSLPDAPVYPGHGDATTIARELAGNPFLR